jgi:hypothetical protein
VNLARQYDERGVLTLRVRAEPSAVAEWSKALADSHMSRKCFDNSKTSPGEKTRPKSPR